MSRSVAIAVPTLVCTTTAFHTDDSHQLAKLNEVGESHPPVIRAAGDFAVTRFCLGFVVVVVFTFGTRSLWVTLANYRWEGRSTSWKSSSHWPITHPKPTHSPGVSASLFSPSDSKSSPSGGSLGTAGSWLTPNTS